MKTRSIKRVAGAAAGAAVAATSMAALAPLPAGAAGGPSVLVGTSATTLGVGYQYASQTGLTLHVHDGATQSVVLVDSLDPILLYIGSSCVLGSSGDTAHPYRATCSGLSAAVGVSVSGTDRADDVRVDTPGHAATINGGAGADILHGSGTQYDVVRGGAGADQLWVQNGDIAGCGENDGAHDTVTYSGTPTFENCKFGGANPEDQKVFSNKA